MEDAVLVTREDACDEESLSIVLVVIADKNDEDVPMSSACPWENVSMY